VKAQEVLALALKKQNSDFFVCCHLSLSHSPHTHTHLPIPCRITDGPVVLHQRLVHFQLFGAAPVGIMTERSDFFMIETRL
jgi:hypothetical protein